MTTSTTPQADLTADQYELMRSAVTLARNENIQTVAQLRFRMHGLYPGREADIAAALNFWANNTRERHPDGVFA